MFLRGAERQGEGVDQGRVQVAQGSDGQAVGVVERVFVNHMNGDKGGKVGAAFVFDPKVNVGLHRGQERLPIGVQSLLAPDRHG